MKKVIYLLVGVLLSLPAIATEMCARNDTIVIPLDSNINATGNSSNVAEATWWAIFPYGRIYGLSTCLSAAEGGKPSGDQGVYTNDKGQMLPNDDALAGRAGQDADGNDRVYCWCKMTHPMSSRWVFDYSLPASGCAANCVNSCGLIARNYPALRRGLFESVGK